MFDIAWSELFVIVIVALVVVGPKDLPKLMRTAGQWAGRARAMADQFKRSFDDMARQTELDELRNQVTKLRSEVTNPMTDLDYESFGINPSDFPSKPLSLDSNIEDVGAAPPKFDEQTAAAPQEIFFAYVKVGMFGGRCLAFPYMAAQLCLYIAPGLYRNERRAFMPFLLATPVMFAVGARFVYFVMLHYALRFFLGFEVHPGTGVLPIEAQPRASEYLSFVTTLIFAFGLCFELPVLLTLLGRVGIVSSAGLKKVRRYAIVGVSSTGS